MNMMAQKVNLVPVIEHEINGELQPCVDARTLHEWLGSKQDFSTWIKRRISQCQFRENFDFVRFHQKVEANNATLVEYIVTADTAKHLGLMERTPQGHLIREYFIEQEKAARNAMYGIQVEINKAMLQLEHVKDVLSNAGRTLCVMGKQVKPQLVHNLDSLVAKAQPQLPLDGS